MRVFKQNFILKILHLSFYIIRNVNRIHKSIEKNISNYLKNDHKTFTSFFHLFSFNYSQSIIDKTLDNSNEKLIILMLDFSIFFVMIIILKIIIFFEFFK